MDCEFEPRAETIEEVIEQCAVHGRSQHEMRSFRPSFYLKIRSCIRIIDEDVSKRDAWGA